MYQIQRSLLICLTLLTAGLSSWGQELTLLHTNDMHSKLTGYGPESEYTPLVTGNDSTTGGFARLSALFQQHRSQWPDATLILDAGDFLMGSLFHAAEKETGFQLNLMKRMGYDCVTLGNHEFDFGPETLAKTLQAATDRGGFPTMVASNLVFSRESPADDPLEELYRKKLILPYTLIEKNGLKIGLFGLVGLDAESVAPASRPVTFSDPLKEAGKTAAYLKEEQQADLVILLSHSGIYPDPQGNGYIGEDIELAAKVPQIDIIISGHTHVATPDYIRIGNTYIVQTGSYAANVGKMQLKIENRKIVNCKFDLIPVDDAIAGDAAVSAEIDQQIRLIDRQYLAPAGLSYKQIIGRTGFDLVCRYTDQAGSNLGPFVADAVRHYTETTGNPADISLVAAGTIREDIVKGAHGNLSVADLFRVMSLGMGYDSIPGYPLARFYLTAHEIKKLMEVLLISRNKGGDGFIYFSGVRVYANPDKGLLRKVQRLEINGQAIDHSKRNDDLYSLAANIYLLGFIGEIKKMSHGLVKLVPKDASGKPVADMQHQRIDADQSKPGIQEAKEWIALVRFIQGFEQHNNIPFIPDIYRQGDHAVIRVNHPL